MFVFMPLTHAVLIFNQLLNYPKQSMQLSLFPFRPKTIPYMALTYTSFPPRCLLTPSSLSILFLCCRQLSSYQSWKLTLYSQWPSMGFSLMGVRRFKSSSGSPHRLYFPGEQSTWWKVVDTLHISSSLSLAKAALSHDRPCSLQHGPRSPQHQP